MKKSIVVIIATLFIACSDGDNTFVIETLPEEVKEPIAVNDTYFAEINTSYTLPSVLENDENIEDITVTIDATSEQNATILKNSDETYTYTPALDFTGKDTFDYTVCANADNEKCSKASVTITVFNNSNSGIFNLPNELKNYYSSVTFTTNSDDLKKELTTLTSNKHTTILFYSERHDDLLKADQDPNNTSNAYLMYTGESRNKSFRQTTSASSGKFNTEHVYPQSLYAGGDGGDARDEEVKGDLHHLRYCDSALNTTRSNKKFVEGSGTAGNVGGEWYPGDDWKGDVARMIFYLNVRYNESISKVSDVNLLLKWNKEDPISSFEIQRNTVISEAQGNRNPFIDNPYLATLIWGGEAAENKWK